MNFYQAVSVAHRLSIETGIRHNAVQQFNGTWNAVPVR